MSSLGEILQYEDTVLFIGSGISLWSGLPTWYRLIEELASYVEKNGNDAELVRRELVRGDLLQAASYGFDKLTKAQMGAFIRTACRYGSAMPQEIHRAIVTLGPSCFVTTNYDNLIELALTKWRQESFFPPAVTNRQLTETADLVHARAHNFVFKPHGDAADSESIILTREQYRALLPQGERQAALEALKMIMVTRPVVYIGYSLRDPDFLYIRDILANTFRGGVRDHYAIVPDPHPAEIEYWRNNYGIHIIGYHTEAMPNGGRDHSSLLALLEASARRENEVSVPAEPSLDLRLSMARYAAGLARYARSPEEFEMAVSADSRGRFDPTSQEFRYDNVNVQEFLQAGPRRALLVGLPGAGKTYAMRRAVAALADDLQRACLENALGSEVVVPIYVDLKTYSGRIVDLIESSFPSYLSYEDVKDVLNVVVFIDSFNEMPSKYFDAASYEQDISEFMASHKISRVVIASRTSDGVRRFDLPVYNLDKIEKDVVIDVLEKQGVRGSDRRTREVVELLRRPIYYRILRQSAGSLPENPTPVDVYRLLSKFARKKIGEPFGAVDIDRALSLLAYNAMFAGEETFLQSDLVAMLEAALQPHGLADRALDLANRLVSADVLMPVRGGRLAFVHQSITEYFAALELSRRYVDDPMVLAGISAHTRWDQALYLCIGLLPESARVGFLSNLQRIDLPLAMRASRYIEVNRDEIVSNILAGIQGRIEREPFDHHASHGLRETLPLNNVHVPALRKFIKGGGIVGAAAAERLRDVLGAEAKPELIAALIEQCGDFNFGYGAGSALRPLCEAEDAAILARACDEIGKAMLPDEIDDRAGGFISGVAVALEYLDTSVVTEAFLEGGLDTSSLRAHVLSSIARERTGDAGIALAGELILLGLPEAAVALHFAAGPFADAAAFDWSPIGEPHLAKLIELRDTDDWVIEAITDICHARPDLRNIAAGLATGLTYEEQLAIGVAAGTRDDLELYSALERWLAVGKAERNKISFRLFSGLKFDWTSRGTLLLDLIGSRDPAMLSVILPGSLPPMLVGVGTLEFGDVFGWLEWVLELATDHHWNAEQIAAIMGKYGSEQTRNQLLSILNGPDRRFAGIIANSIAVYWDDITTDELSEPTVEYLLSQLSRGRLTRSVRGPLLGLAATERFVEERLLGLLSTADDLLRQNVAEVLVVAGGRHGRRYVLNT